MRIIKLGETYKLKGSPIKGVLTELDDSMQHGRLEVQGKYLKVKIENIEPLVHKKTKDKQKSEITIPQASRTKRRKKLDLHGMTRAIAGEKLVEFLDIALRENIDSIELVHGHGTGKIKDLVVDFLTHSPYVASFHTPENNRAAIIAYLK